MKFLKFVLPVVVAGAAFAATPAAAVTILDFEGVGNLASVDDFYNGGTDSQGNSGTDFGIQFSNTSLGVIDSDAGGSGNIANETTEDTVLFFLDGDAATMNVFGGFDTGFSFFYSSEFSGFVTVYDDLDGMGNVLATLDLAGNIGSCAGDPNGRFCQFDPFGVTFDGTAMSVDFGGVADRVAFDNITLGSATPAIPEPATWAMLILGLFGVGGMMRRQKQNAEARISFS